MSNHSTRGHNSNNKKTLKIIHWNARSILPKISDLKNMMGKEAPDIVTINETWLNQKKRLHLKGYTTFRKDRGTTGGGVLIMVMERYQASEQHIQPFQLEFLLLNPILHGGGREKPTPLVFRS